MNGTNALTGKRLSGFDHLRQSITDILTTPLGSRVMRRDYGSRLFELIDQPINRGTLAAIYAATVEALARWEPRVQITQVRASAAEPGKVTLDVIGIYLPDGKSITMEGIIVS